MNPKSFLATARFGEAHEGAAHKMSSAASAVNASAHFRICVCGSVDVGKTTLINRITRNVHIAALPTVGVEYSNHVFNTSDGVKINTVFLDVAGADRFKHNRPSAYNGATAVLVVFDASTMPISHTVPHWIKEVTAHTSAHIFLVGCKVNTKTEATGHDVERIAELNRIDDSVLSTVYGNRVFYVSACTNFGVEELWNELQRVQMMTVAYQNALIKASVSQVASGDGAGITGEAVKVYQRNEPLLRVVRSASGNGIEVVRGRGLVNLASPKEE